MIRITSAQQGRAQYVAAAAIAHITEASAPSKFHGIRSIVRLFDGAVIEAREDAKDLVMQVEKEATR